MSDSKKEELDEAGAPGLDGGLGPQPLAVAVSCFPMAEGTGEL